jgi:superfamily II DNA/RNA helicase
VINYSVPEDEKAYLHRIGRTGRAGKTGIAVTFVDWEDLTRWVHINKELELGKPEPVETYSNSPQLFEDLNIPAGTKGRLTAKKPEAKTERPKSEGSKSGQTKSASTEKPAAKKRERRRNYSKGS